MVFRFTRMSIVCSFYLWRITGLRSTILSSRFVFFRFRSIRFMFGKKKGKERKEEKKKGKERWGEERKERKKMREKRGKKYRHSNANLDSFKSEGCSIKSGLVAGFRWNRGKRNSMLKNMHSLLSRTRRTIISRKKYNADRNRYRHDKY